MRKAVNIMNQKLKDEILMREMLGDDGPLDRNATMANHNASASS